MEKLKFPIIKGDPMPPPILSMDRYVRFVEMFIQSFLNRKDYEEQKKRSVVTVPFKLR